MISKLKRHVSKNPDYFDELLQQEQRQNDERCSIAKKIWQLNRDG